SDHLRARGSRAVVVFGSADVFLSLAGSWASPMTWRASLTGASASRAGSSGPRIGEFLALAERSASLAAGSLAPRDSRASPRAASFGGAGGWLALTGRSAPWGRGLLSLSGSTLGRADRAASLSDASLRRADWAASLSDAAPRKADWAASLSDGSLRRVDRATSPSDASLRRVDRATSLKGRIPQVS